jgi:hypothetical protein
MVIHHGQTVTVDVLANDVVASSFPELEVRFRSLEYSKSPCLHRSILLRDVTAALNPLNPRHSIASSHLQLELVQKPEMGIVFLKMDGLKGLVTYQPLSYVFKGNDVLIYRVSAVSKPYRASASHKRRAFDACLMWHASIRLKFVVAWSRRNAIVFGR